MTTPSSGACDLTLSERHGCCPGSLPGLPPAAAVLKASISTDLSTGIFLPVREGKYHRLKAHDSPRLRWNSALPDSPPTDSFWQRVRIKEQHSSTNWNKDTDFSDICNARGLQQLGALSSSPQCVCVHKHALLYGLASCLEAMLLHTHTHRWT